MNVRKLWEAIALSPNDSLSMTTLKTIALAVIVIVLTSCKAPEVKLAPGEASASRAGTNVTMVVKQSEDAAAPATQEHTITTEEEYALPEGWIATNEPHRGLVFKRVKTTDTMRTTIGEAQDNTEARNIYAKGLAAFEQMKAFMNGVKWIPLIGLLPLGILVFSFTPWGRPMAISKEGRLVLAGMTVLCVMAPAMSQAVRENAVAFAGMALLAVAAYFIWERKTHYKVEAALRTPVPTQ